MLKFRRFLVVVLSMALVLSYAPVISVAEEGARGAVHVDLGHDHSDGSWTAWGDGEGESTSLPLSSGKYYLTRDITVSAQHRLTGGQDIELCMNGYSINSTSTAWGSVYQIYGTNINLTIENCGTSGKITRSVSGGNALMGSGGSSSGSLTLTNVTIDGIKGTNNGTGITVQGTTTLTMTGCTITNCTSSGYAPVLFAAGSGLVTLKDCDIKDNSSTATSGSHFPVIRGTGTSKIVFDGCLFTGNSGRTASVYSSNSSGATVTFKDCTVTGNTTTDTGNSTGCIYLLGNNATLEGSNIVKNNKKGNGSAVGFTMQNATNTFSIKNAGDDADVDVSYVADPAEGAELATITGSLKGSWTWLKDDTKMLVDDGSGKLVLVDAAIRGIRLPATAEAEVGKTSTLTPDFIPENTPDTDKGVTWTTSAPGIATVDANGVVTGVSAGQATITVTSQVNAEYTASCLVTVTEVVIHEHDGLSFDKWTSATTLPSTSGNYYLSSDVTLDSVWDVPNGADITLCLNGHSIISDGSSRVIRVQTGGKLAVTDCSDTPGSIKGGKSTYGAGVRIQPGGEFDLYNGIIEDNTSNASTGGEGAGIYILGRNTVSGTKYDGGIFNMYGGKITGNTGGVGAAVNIYGYSGNADIGGEYEPGTFNMYGGEITGNTGTTGTIYARTNSKVNISGGSITDNTVSASGGALFMQSGSQGSVGQVTITGNSAGANGGAIRVNAGAELLITGAQISGNSAVALGGGIYATGNAVINITGGEIGSNTAPKGGSIYLDCDDENKIFSRAYIANASIVGGATDDADHTEPIWSKGFVYINNVLTASDPVYQERAAAAFDTVGGAIKDTVTATFGMIMAPKSGESFTATYSNGAETVQAELTEVDEAAGTYRFDATVNVNRIASPLNLVIKSGSETINEKADYTVMEYFDSLAAATETLTTEQKTFMANLITFAGLLQQYAVDNEIANPGEAVTPSPWVEDFVTSETSTVNNKQTTVHAADPAHDKISAANLVISDRISLRFKFISQADSTIQVKKNGQLLSESAYTVSAGRVDLPRLSPADYSAVYEVAILNAGTPVHAVTYSVNTYCTVKNADAEIGGLVNAIFNYGTAAAALLD